MNMERNGIVLILSGPSGSGKSTLYKNAVKGVAEFEFSVSCTTRAPRPGEQDGVDYHFKTREEFEKLIAADAFAEHAEVHGNFYGTLKSELIERHERGINVLLDIDVQGARQIRELCKRDPLFEAACEFVFVMPPGIEELRKRLTGRGTETEETLARRLKNAEAEMACWNEYDYVVVNDDLEKSTQEFSSLIRALQLAVKRIKKQGM